MSWQLQLFNAENTLLWTTDLSGPGLLGRQNKSDERPLTCSLDEQQQLSRLVLAGRDERSISREHALVEPLAEGGFRLTNRSESLEIRLLDRGKLLPGEAAVLTADSFLQLGVLRVRLRQTVPNEPALHSLGEKTSAPGQASSVGLPPLPASSPELRALLPWLNAAVDVLHSAAGSTDFFDQTARALVTMARMDTGRVLLRRGEEWASKALARAVWLAADQLPSLSRRVLAEVSQHKRTFWEEPDRAEGLSQDRQRKLAAVVAAPILDRRGAVLGVLYGDRLVESGQQGRGPIAEVEALLVELLARGVAAGLARLEQEAEAVRARVQLEQHFTPELARNLASRPDRLEGREAEVTVLVCAVPGLSRACERLGPARNGAWIADVLGDLSGCVRAEEGVLVDYPGDELLALWGAPGEQPDHARRACRAAQTMVGCLPELSQRWQAETGEPLQIGVGISTGPAYVGNIGSRHKFKYGPQGKTVNLASRVLEATRYFKTRVLLTADTQAKLDAGFATRRLGKVRLQDIPAAVEIHELAGPELPDWERARAEYELALAEFENKRFGSVTRILAAWRQQPGGANDAPALVLLARAVNCMVEVPDPFDPVWVLSGG